MEVAVFTKLHDKKGYTVLRLGYGLQCLGFQSRYGEDIFLLSISSKQGVGTTEPPIQCVPGFFLGG